MNKITNTRKRAFKWFSQYIRLKDAKNGRVRCFTCGIVKPWKEMHAGHFIHGVTKRTYFEETNVHPQCNKCNTYLGGNLINYTLNMISKYGQDEVERLRKLSHDPKVWTISELKEIEKKYKQKVVKKLQKYDL